MRFSSFKTLSILWHSSNVEAVLYAQASYIIADEMFDQYPNVVPDSYYGISGSAIALPYTPSTTRQATVAKEFTGSVAFGLGYVNTKRRNFLTLMDFICLVMSLGSPDHTCFACSV
jgi:hypothetical protein